MTTDLQDRHRLAGAVFVERDGLSVPAHYGQPQEEHFAVRQAAGMRDVGARGRLRLTGQDRAAWLHSICTQEIRSLVPGQGTRGACINDVGRLIFDFTLWVTSDALLLDVEGSVREKALAWLDHYLITEDVTIDDVSTRYHALEVSGPLAAGAVQRTTGLDVATTSYACAEGDGVLLLGTGEPTGETTYQVWSRPGRLDTLWDDLKLRPYGLDAYETLRIEAGHSVYGVDMDEDNNPLEAGLNRALSMDKGCYTGQEVMARLTFRQGPVRVLMGFACDRLLPRGTSLLVGSKEMGRITSSVQSPTLGIPIAMGYVRREHKEPGSTLQAGETPVEVVLLPWYHRP